MVEGIAGRVDHAPAIGDGDTAPLFDQLGEMDLALLLFRRFAFFLHVLGVAQKFVSNFRLFLVVKAAHRLFTIFPHQNIIALAEFLHLAHVIGHGFGGRIDSR